MKKIIVTGAAGDIGSEIVSQGLEAGYDVIGIGRKASDTILSLDITDYEGIQKFYSKFNFETFPRILINNAGVYLGKNLLDYSKEDISKVIDINVIGTALMTQAFLKGAESRGVEGKVINISSIAGVEGGSDAIYAASKAAQIGLTKSAAKVKGITAYTVAPGLVSGTGMESRVPKSILAHYDDTLTSCGEVASMVLTLVGESHEYKNGDTVSV